MCVMGIPHWPPAPICSSLRPCWRAKASCTWAWPFQPEEFIAVSVNVVPGVDFRPRFQAVLDRAASVSLLSDLPSSHDAVAFIFAFRVLNGLALIKSRLSGLPLFLWRLGMAGPATGRRRRRFCAELAFLWLAAGDRPAAP